MASAGFPMNSAPESVPVPVYSRCSLSRFVEGSAALVSRVGPCRRQGAGRLEALAAYRCTFTLGRMTNHFAIEPASYEVVNTL